MKKTKQIQVKFFKEESIFNRIDRESLAALPSNDGRPLWLF